MGISAVISSSMSIDRTSLPGKGHRHSPIFTTRATCRPVSFCFVPADGPQGLGRRIPFDTMGAAIGGKGFEQGLPDDVRLAPKRRPKNIPT